MLLKSGLMKITYYNDLKRSGKIIMADKDE